MPTSTPSGAHLADARKAIGQVQGPVPRRLARRPVIPTLVALVLVSLLNLLPAQLASAQRTRPVPDAPERRPLILPPIPFPSDSGRGDQLAFESLPDAVREVLDVRRDLQPQGGAKGFTCIPLSFTSDGSRRQRVQGRLQGYYGLVVFARVARDGTLARVEFVRRLADGSQRGYTWDAAGDATTAMEWPPGSTEAESHPVPRGSPIPRAVRGLGRLVLTWRCAET
ncbi:MAG: hypothetical protein IPF98_12690 [Gemmatimonadetes bacterium]|nr:hypothetical protein [Gemmatimonadota bacterium]MCC6771478.1 hypothetical protein [Gemmatimonadaceae bacterium]